MDDILQRIAAFEEKLRKINLKKLILLLPIILIIALIPLIRMIFDIEQRSFYRTALDIEEAAINSCSNKDTYSLIVFGRMMENEFDFHGELPDSGRIAVSEDCQVALALHDGENCAIKYFWDDDILVDKRRHEDCIIYRDIFTDNVIMEKLAAGYIPINSVDDLKAINQQEEYTFAKDQLYELTKAPTLSDNYILTADLDLENSNFRRIGNQENPFTGIFNGNNHFIDNYQVEQKEGMSANDDQTIGIGFFHRLENAAIKNFNLNVNLHGIIDIGALAIYAKDSQIENITITGKITGHYSVSGLVKEANNLKISKTKIDLEISGINDVSPMIVTGQNITIENSYLMGQINSEQLAADFINEIITNDDNDDNLATIKNSYSIVEYNSPEYIRMVRADTDRFQIINSYYGVTEIDPAYASDTTRSFSDLQKKETYQNWDFEKIWEFSNQYPSLQKNH